MSKRPLLIWDGDCAFCGRWARRFDHVAHGRVEVVPYQEHFEELAKRFPDVPPEAYAEAVQLFEPDGDGEARHTSGAEAVFRTLAYGSGLGRSLRWAYDRVPGVGPVSEWGYRLVARHRSAAGWTTTILHGRELRPASWAWVRWLWLRLLGLTLLMATVSLWVQVDGLIGSQGILPASAFLDRVTDVAASQGWEVEQFRLVPTLLWLGPSDGALHALCAGTTLASLLVFLNVLTGPALLLAWLGMLSLAAVGQVFLGYQWDALLLEATFASLLIAPWDALRPGVRPHVQPSRAALWVLRILLFKLMLSSGLVKELSGDAAWGACLGNGDGATPNAMEFHYWTQPLPSWISWYAHQLPSGWHAFSCGTMFVIELWLPWLIFLGRRARQVACVGFVALQLGIALTGNYGFFNALSAALALTLLDDDALRALVPKRWRARLVDPRELHPDAPGFIGLPSLQRLLAGALIVLSVTRVATLGERGGGPAVVADVAEAVQPLRVSNGYGLFAVMTRERPEIRIEASDDGETWAPYVLPYKPGPLDRAPSVVGPHMPRLDWQLWFAGLRGRCQQAPWTLQLARRLLEGSPPVLELFERVPAERPAMVRMMLAKYRFTTPGERERTGAWWAREPAGTFCPPLSLGPAGQLVRAR